MPFALKAYACILCKKRTNHKERRFLFGPNNKHLRHFLSKRYTLDVSEHDVVCNKCRQRFYHAKRGMSCNMESTSSAGNDLSPPRSPLTTLYVQSAVYRHDACAICERKGRKLLVVTDQMRCQLFIHSGVFLKSAARCCPSHVKDGRFSDETLKKGVSSKTRDSTSFKSTELVNLIEGLRKIAEKNRSTKLNFEKDSDLTDDDYLTLTGLHKQQFEDIVTNVRDLKNTKTRGIRTCIAVLLVKLRCAVENKILATLFSMSKWQIRRAVSSARKALVKDFVPQNLGFGHVSRDDVINQHTTPLADELFSGGLGVDPKALLVLDGTYIYVQKSNNFSFARRSYSMHKHRPLVKPMMVVTTSGYIVSVLGPYLADAKNNDAGILNHMIAQNVEEMRNWLSDGDVFIVDRGFRDSSQVLSDVGIKMEMPSFLPRGAKQHTTEESNTSRLVTKVRWVVESANGRLKRWKYLDRVVPNTQIPYIGDYVRIVSAICNKYTEALSSGDNEEDRSIAMKMLHLSRQPNELKDIVESQGLDKRSYKWERIDATNVAGNFPKLTEDEVRLHTLGVYQVKMAKAYAFEHLQEDGGYEIMINEDIENIIGTKIQSRHVSAKKYLCWIRYEEGVITGWYCKCKAGARVVGCCAHITSVIWYLAHGRHQERSVQGVRDWSEYLDDASRVIDESDSGEESQLEE